jgi:hypothetical protein
MHEPDRKGRSESIPATPAALADALAGPDAANATLVDPEQTECLNQMLRGHYAYYGIAGKIWAL